MCSSLSNRTRARRGQGDHNREAPAAVAFAAAHATEREAVIDRRVLEATALQHAMGRADLEGIRQAITAKEQSHILIRAGKPDWQQPQGVIYDGCDAGARTPERRHR